MSDVILAIDQGTTGTAALLIDRRGRLRGRGYHELPQRYPRPGWVEHDPHDILRITWAAIRQALSHARLHPTQIAAIGITNQRETTILWDRRTGRPLANAIVWQCRRTAPQCDDLKRRGHAETIHAKTGLVVDAYFSATKLQWLLRHVPGAASRARHGHLAFGTVDAWLLWHLTGGRVHATDYTNASRTMLYNIRRFAWDRELLRLFGVPASVLPAVRPSSGLFGTTARIGPLPAGLPIAGIAGDQQAALFGHGCVSSGAAKNTYGTGCFLLLHTGNRCVLSHRGLLTTLSCNADGTQPAYALEGSVFIAGAAIQWLRDGLQLIRRAAETEPIARATASTGGVYVVPAFVGLGAPYWDMGARGAILGLTRGTTRSVIVRATLEALAYQTKDVVDAMQREAKVRLRELEVDGGATANNWLMQFQADLLGVPVVRPRVIAATAQGAAALAGRAIGWWPRPHTVGAFHRVDRVFRPRMVPRERAALYQGWQQAVARVRTAV
ncbi:MAG: glycerol kinase GlpK [Candidatus Omnitrophica bacterium]|nr:glycerol kinase GlpK [Candidatus Omnitrophota bacterium]